MILCSEHKTPVRGCPLCEWGQPREDRFSTASVRAWTARDEKDEMAKFDALSLPEQLRQQARSLYAEADSFKGASWVGTHPPGYYSARQAQLLERAANEIERLTKLTADQPQ